MPPASASPPDDRLPLAAGRRSRLAPAARGAEIARRPAPARPPPPDMTSAAGLAPHRLGGFQRFRRPLLAAAVLAVLVWWAAGQCHVSVADLGPALARSVEVGGFFLPPDWRALPELVAPALVTILLAAVATPLGLLLSLGFGFAGARNLAPGWLRLPARGLIGVERALPELITLLLLVAALGIGPFPGVMALAIGSVGMLGKLIADAIEEIDPRVLESVESVGATRAQTIRHAVLPEILPGLLASTIFRFEVNVRSSVLLGAAGAGGIGFELGKSMAMLEYERAMMAIVVTLALVFGAERLSDFLRRRVLDGGKLK